MKNDEPVACKPYAWFAEQNDDYLFFRSNAMKNFHESKGVKFIPLYTHPAELTDEEIKKIANDYWWSEEVAEEHINFARAILRKEQDK